MKTLLLCPTHRPAVAHLAESGPLVLLPVLGRTVVEHWLEHLAARGARDVRILALDRPERVREVVRDGSRWGLRVEVLPENDEPAPPEARLCRGAFCAAYAETPGGTIVIDYLPGLPALPLYESYEGWYRATQAALPMARMSERIGRVEIAPGISIGHMTRVSRSARLNSPCWIGDNVFVGPDAVIGPDTVVEDRAYVSRGADLAQSLIGPDTFVGELTRVRGSLAQGNRLINWRSGSCLDVPDTFLLCSLADPQGASRPAPKPAAAARDPLAGLRDLVPRSQS